MKKNIHGIGSNADFIAALQPLHRIDKFKQTFEELAQSLPWQYNLPTRAIPGYPMSYTQKSIILDFLNNMDEPTFKEQKTLSYMHKIYAYICSYDRLNKMYGDKFFIFPNCKELIPFSTYEDNHITNSFLFIGIQQPYIFTASSEFSKGEDFNVFFNGYFNRNAGRVKDHTPFYDLFGYDRWQYFDYQATLGTKKANSLAEICRLESMLLSQKDLLSKVKKQFSKVTNNLAKLKINPDDVFDYYSDVEVFETLVKLTIPSFGDAASFL